MRAIGFVGVIRVYYIPSAGRLANENGELKSNSGGIINFIDSGIGTGDKGMKKDPGAMPAMLPAAYKYRHITLFQPT